MPDVVPSTRIPGLLSIDLQLFEDERGGFVETFNVDEWQFADAEGAPITFVEDDYSINRRGVIRGLHGDDGTWKLVSCPHGSCFVVVVDPRGGAPRPTWEGYSFDARAPRQLLVPSGCATGFASLQDDTVFTYKQSQRYDGAARQFTLRWDDPAIGIDWPFPDPIVSERDRSAPLLGS